MFSDEEAEYCKTAEGTCEIRAKLSRDKGKSVFGEKGKQLRSMNGGIAYAA